MSKPNALCQGAAGQASFKNSQQGNAAVGKETQHNADNRPASDFIGSSMQNHRPGSQMTNFGVNTNAANGSASQKPENAMANPPGTPSVRTRGSMDMWKDYLKRNDREPIVGLDYVVEYRFQVQPDRIETRYFCELCELDGDLVAMLYHVISFTHRRLYMAKKYPFLFKVHCSTKEEKEQFLRSMAMGIEEEEGTKMYKSDPVLRSVPMLTARSRAGKQIKQKTRWDFEEGRQRRMKKALEYIELFEIASDGESTVVVKLMEKLTAELKVYSEKIKKKALSTTKVARANDVATSIMQKDTKAKTELPNPVQNPVGKQTPPFIEGSPSFRKGPPENTSGSMPTGQPNSDRTYWTSSSLKSPYPEKLAYHMAMVGEANLNSQPQTDSSNEDNEFLKKQKALLQNSQMNRNPFLHGNQIMQSQKYMHMNNGSVMLRHQTGYLQPEYAGTSLCSKDLGHGGNYGYNDMNQYDDTAPSMVMSNKLTSDSYAGDMSYGYGMYSGERDEPIYRNISKEDVNQVYDYTAEQAPYTRVSLSLGDQKSEHEGVQDNQHRFHRETIPREIRQNCGVRSSQSFNDPAWAERESTMPYGKRVKLNNEQY